MPFRLSTRGHYAVLLMYELARTPEEFVSLAQVAAAQSISQGYLEQLIKPLRESKLVSAKKGAQGGYRLSKSPSNITVGEVVRAVEGPVVPVKCCLPEHQSSSCSENCRAKKVWLMVSQAIDNVLDSITLEDLVKGDVS